MSTDDFGRTITRTLPGNLRDLTQAEEREIIALEGIRTVLQVAIEFNLTIQRVRGIWNRSYMIIWEHKFDIYKRHGGRYEFGMTTNSSNEPDAATVLQAFADAWPDSCDPDDPTEGTADWAGSTLIQQ